MNLLLFAGTTEGRLLARRLRDLPLRATLCTATGYGEERLAEFAGRFALRAGRMNAEEMCALMRDENIHLVIDATHPYAVAATAAIRAAAESAGIPRLRLARAAGRTGDDDDGVVCFDSAQSAAAALAETEGGVLLATGAKELAAFTAVPGFAERCCPRVLPTEESLRACAALGFPRSRIIAMQGPFSRELNLALMRHFAVAILVTKDGGAEGGFAEKLQAAADAGVRTFVIRRPGGEDGLSTDEILAAVAERLQQEPAQ